MHACGGKRSRLHSMQAVIPGIITLVFPLKPKRDSAVNIKVYKFSLKLLSSYFTLG